MEKKRLLNGLESLIAPSHYSIHEATLLPPCPLSPTRPTPGEPPRSLIDGTITATALRHGFSPKCFNQSSSDRYSERVSFILLCLLVIYCNFALNILQFFCSNSSSRIQKLYIFFSYLYVFIHKMSLCLSIGHPLSGKDRTFPICFCVIFCPVFCY